LACRVWNRILHFQRVELGEADGALTDRLAGYRGPSWPVTEVRLWQSFLGPVPRYETVATWPVG